MKLSHISTGSPSYWPADLNKLPDLLDFCITKGISSNLVKAESSLDLPSDHTAVIVTVFDKYKINENKIYLHSKKTIWTLFRDIVSNLLSLNVSLKSAIDIENAINVFTTTIQNPAFRSTLEYFKNYDRSTQHRSC